MKHIGILGCTYPATAHFFKLIAEVAAPFCNNFANPPVSVFIDDFSRYFNSSELERDIKWSELLLAGANKLIAAGTEFIVCPANSVHRHLRIIARKIAVPYIDITDPVVTNLREFNISTVGLLGTTLTIKNKIYDNALQNANIQCILPSSAKQSSLDNIIQTDFIFGKFQKSGKEIVINCAEELISSGAQAIILGCTELPISLEGTTLSVPFVDSNLLLAQSAVNYSLSVLS